MEYYDRPNYGYYRAQLVSTRNLPRDAFTTWFTGGLNFQIEHHLFPRMPRHQYSKVCDRVEKMCKKNNIDYEEKGIWECSVHLMKYLTDVATQNQSKSK
jgi:fatty acid desaturase